MRKDKKDRILKRFPHGIVSCGKSDVAAFAKEIGTTEKYIKDVLRAYKKDFVGNHPPLTVKNYITAVLNGYRNKKDLGIYFGFSTRTIIRFEKETKIKERLNDYFDLWKPYGDIHGIITSLFDVKKKMKAIADDYKPAERNLRKLVRVIDEIKAIKCPS